MKNILNLKDIFGNPIDIPEDVEKQCSNDTKRGKNHDEAGPPPTFH